MKDICSNCDDNDQETKLTLQLGEWNCVKVHLALQKWSFQIKRTPYPRSRKHAWVICRLQQNTISLESLIQWSRGNVLSTGWSGSVH